MAPMTLARLALLIAVYVALDVSNPMMPGALTFGIDDSVEVRQAERYRGLIHQAATIPRVPEPAGLDLFDGPRARPARPAPVSPALRRAPVTRSHLSVAAPVSPIEDH
jgi:hypothetical protein